MADQVDFYVYVIFRPNGVPCYVGKGRGDRWFVHKKLRHRHHNKHLANIIAKAGGDLPLVKIRDGLIEAQAFEIERAIIAAIGREAKGGSLVNLTDGGEGASGRPQKPISEETRMRLRISHLGKKQTEETKEKRAQKNRGKKRSPEWCAANRARRTGEKRNQEARKNISLAKIGVKLTVDHRLKISESTKKALASPEVRKKISDASTALWASRRAENR